MAKLNSGTRIYGTANVDTQINIGANVIANTTGVFPASNTVGTQLGNTISRWVVSANTINASGLITADAGAIIQGTANLVNVNISGNLTVSGTTTYVNTTNLNVGDNIVTLNADLTNLTAPTENAGLEINRGSAANVNFLWNETSDSWTLGNTTITGFANASVSVNSALLTVGTNFIANTLGAYHTGTVNASSYTTSGITANTSGVYPSSNTVGTALGTTTNRWNLTANAASFTGQVEVRDTWDTATGNGAIYLDGATGNRIDWNIEGVAAPAITTRSAGTKLVLYPQVSATSVDFGMGIETNHMWFSVADTGDGFKWYANTTQLAVANTSGITVGSGGIFPTSNSTATSLGSATQRWVLNANTGSFAGAVSGITTLATGNTTITGFANASVSVNSALLTVGTSFIANTTGAYHTGLVNAASINIGGSGFIANSIAIVLAEPVTANGTTGTSGQVLTSNGTVGSPYWTSVSAGLSIGGSNTQVQFNDSGNLGANTLLTYDSATGYLTTGNSTFGSINNGRPSPSLNIGFQQEKVYANNATTYGMYVDTLVNNTAYTATRTHYGAQFLTVANTLSQNTLGSTISTTMYGVVGSTYNAETTGGNSRLGTMAAGYFLSRNYATGATANTVDNMYGVRAFSTNYGSGTVTTAVGVDVSVGAGNTTTAGAITTAYGIRASIDSNTAMTIGTGYIYYGDYGGSTTTTKYGIYITGESNNYVSNNITVGGNAYAVIFSATSDERLKSNIEIVVDPVEKIKSLKGVNFTYTASNTRSIGVIAQDVEQQMPELVDINSEGYRQVNYNGIIGVLVEAVKQQQKEIENLKQNIERLK